MTVKKTLEYIWYVMHIQEYWVSFLKYFASLLQLEKYFVGKMFESEVHKY